MSLDPRTVWKKAATRAATATPNVVGGATMVALSAALWNPLPLVLWGLGSAAWVLFASTSPKYTRRILDEDRRAADQTADREREALRAKIASILAWQPYATWVRAGLLPDYLHVFERLVAVRDRVTYLLAERKEDYLAGLGIQSQLTYLLTAFLQFVQARLALLQTLLDFRPGGAAGGGVGGVGGVGSVGGVRGVGGIGDLGGVASDRGGIGGAGAVGNVGGVGNVGNLGGAGNLGGVGNVGRGAPAGAGEGGAAARTAGDRGAAPRTAGAFGERGASRAPLRPSPMTPITMRTPGAAGAFSQPAPSATAATFATVPPAEMPEVSALLGDLDRRIAALHELADREPAAKKTREWHIGILQKQQELLRDCASRDQQLVAQLTAVPDAFDVIAGRISAAQFDAAELAAYTGGVVEQIEETEKFVQTMRPVTDELLAGAPTAAPTGAPTRVGTA
jgi:hypothetical protein